MKRKYKFQVFQDVIMLLILLSLMGYHLWGENTHELLGVSFFIITTLHMVLNLHWFVNLKQGAFPVFRVLQIVINSLLILAFSTAIVSGLMLSRHLFPDLVIHNPSDWVRKVHMTSVHWGQVIIALHLGMHWKMLAKFFCKIWHISPTHVVVTRIMPAICIMISIYGCYAFITRNMPSYLFMRVDFSFFEFGEPKLIFYTDFLAITIFMAYFTRYLLWLFLFRKNQAY
nr:DUF4405 domain-containing protein [uncultured Tolumonas sp.]